MEPEPTGAPGVLDVPEGEPPPTAPPVVAVVVTTDGAALEGTLASLRDQDYPALSVLVLDAGSSEDPTPRIGAVLPGAFVRRLPGRCGFAHAANEVIASVEGAPFLLFCHDDVELAPDAVRVLVEEAYRSNAGIVGPKLVEHGRPDHLLEVGLAIDHYGVPFAGIEPGEVDQEQHDAVRDVFFVSHAAMLVRTDLFAELGGFDPRTAPGSDDLDLCWRARLAGARILVAPDARVRHHGASLTESARDARDVHEPTREATAARVRVLWKSYSAVALVWVLPVALALNAVEVVALLLTGRARRAAALVGGWYDAVRRPAELRRARRATQALREVPDADVRDLMVRGSARVRSYVTVRLHAGDRLQDVSVRTREAVGGAGAWVRRPEALAAGALVLVLVAGSRSLVLGRVPEVGGFVDWPGLGALLRAFLSPWRFVGVGADAPAPPSLGLMSALSALFLGDTDVARTVVVAGAIPLGAFGAFRFARPLSPSAWPAVAASLAYAAHPAARNAVSRGLLGPLVCFALAPFLLATLLRAISEERSREERRRDVLVLALLGAVVASSWPPALLVVPAAAAAVLVAAPLVGGWRLAARGLVVAGLATVGAALLLAPWSLSFLGADAATVGLVAREPVALTDVLRGHTGPAGAGLAPLGLVVAATLPLLVASGARLAWAARAWGLVVVSCALVWLPEHLGDAVPTADPEGVLVLAALGLALAIALGTAVFVDQLQRIHFGWRQLAAAVAAGAVAVSFVGLVADAVGGRWDLPRHGWPEALAWTRDEGATGGFRILWLGDASLLPADAKVTDDLGYAITRDGPGDVRERWGPPARAADREVQRAITLAVDGRTAHLGHLLAPAGVRYVAFVERAAPGAGRRVTYDARLAAALPEQLDLAALQSDDGMRLYENRAWIPVRAVLDPASVGGGDDAVAAALHTDASGATAVRGPRRGSLPASPGTLLDAEASDAGWRASAGGRRLDRAEGFGWTNAYELPARDRVSLRFSPGLLPRALLGLQVLLWVAAITVWWRSRRAARSPA
jgi:GT2 family glycosyltransferase